MRNPSKLLIQIGYLLIASSLVFFILIFYPVITLELKYFFQRPNPGIEVSLTAKNAVVPVDEEFGIIIPKIGANSKVIADVNPYDSKVYQYALTKGVAHAKGTALPSEIGNMFLFSHSSANFYEASRYNSIFYLLSKLEKDDEIYIFYKKEKFKYKVTNKKIVDAKDISYLNPKSDVRTLTLMTCWPPGTTYKRLLIIAEAD